MGRDVFNAFFSKTLPPQFHVSIYFSLFNQIEQFQSLCACNLMIYISSLNLIYKGGISSKSLMTETINVQSSANLPQPIYWVPWGKKLKLKNLPKFVSLLNPLVMGFTRIEPTFGSTQLALILVKFTCLLFYPTPISLFLCQKMQFMNYFFHKAKVVIFIFILTNLVFCYQNNCKTFGGKNIYIILIFFVSKKN